MDPLREGNAIRDLNRYYALVCDTFRLEETVNCWTADGIFDERESGLGFIRGHDELRAFFRDRIFADARNVVHMMFNHLVTDIEETQAKGTCFTLVKVLRKSGERARIHAMYDDEYAKVGDDWKFRSRVIKQSFPIELIHQPAAQS